MNKNEQEIIFRFTPNQTSANSNVEKIYSSLLLAPIYSDKSLNENSKANLVDMAQNEQFNIVFKLIDVLTKSGNINFVNVSLAALFISSSLFLLLIVTFFVLKLNLCKSKSRTNTNKRTQSANSAAAKQTHHKHETSCEKNSQNTMSITNISLDNKIAQKELISDRLEEKSKNRELQISNRKDLSTFSVNSNEQQRHIANSSQSFLCKCIGRSNSTSNKQCREKASNLLNKNNYVAVATSTAAAVVADVSSDSTTTASVSLPDKPSATLFKPRKQFVINCISCIGSTRSDRRRNTTSTNNYKSKRGLKPVNKSLVTSPHHQINKIKKQPKYTTQFSISFHKFSLRSPSVSSLARRKLVYSSHQNNEYKSQRQVTDMLNQRCCLSVSVVPFDRSNGNNNNNHNNANNPSNNHNNNSSNAKSKNKNKKKSSSKQIFEEDDLNDSYSREKPITNKLPSSVLDNPVVTSKSPSLVFSNNSDYEPHSSAKSASLLSHNDFHKIDLLISSKKAAAAASAASTAAGVATISSIETEDDKIAKQVALFKQKNICSKELSPSLLSQQLNRNSSTSTSTLESFQVQQTEITTTTTSPPPQPPPQPQPSKSVNTNELLSINIENTNHNLNNTINSRYQHFDKSRNKLVSTVNNSNSSANSNNSSLASKNLNSFGEEIFDFSLRINRLRFIDDSASSTALTSPAESINNFFSHFNNNNININRQHKPQQQHNKLYCNSGLATPSHNNSQLSVNTSSSRTISMLPSSTNESCASTPGSGSIGAGQHLTISNSKRMLVPIQRQENVKSSTETICSNDTHSLASSSATSATTRTETKQFQHELLENYRKPSTSVPHHHQQQPDNEDDEEIKNIILNNLNEKLKSGTSAAVTASKHHYQHHHRHKHHQLQQPHQHYRKKVQSSATIADCSSSNYTTTELDSSSSECEPVTGVNHQHFHYYSGIRQTATAVTAKTIKKTSNKHSSSSSSSSGSTSNTAHTTPPLDYNEIVCNSCCKKNQNTNTHMPTLTVAASNSNCKYCKLLLNYESTSSGATSTAASISNQRSPSNIGYSPVVSANSNRIKSKGDDRVYAYENFDCINECLEETDILNQIIDSKINSRKIQKVQLNNRRSQNEENQDEEEEDDDEDTTSILVEDGFIRMSSPVGNEDKQQTHLDHVKLTSKPRLNKPVNQSIKQQQQQLTNFPNVGSSPLSEEFLNSDCSSSENEEVEDDERTLNETINDQEKSNEEEEHLKENSDSFDGIIILGSLKKNNSKCTDQLNSNAVLTDVKEALSLSDDEEIVVEEDEDEEEEEEEEEKKTEYVEFNNSTTSPMIEETVSTKANTIQNDQPSHPQSLLIGTCNKQPPHSIMKQKPTYSDPNKTTYNRIITNLEQSSSSSIVSNGSAIQPTSPTSGINITNSINAASNNNVLSASSNLLLSSQSLTNSNSQSVSNQAISSINQTTHHPPKPKVRFNLDINYEKEREWNRASKLIGDASKTQIEWTQEVEV